MARQLLKVKFQICFHQFPCIVSYLLSNFQTVSELNLQVRSILAYVIESYNQLYQMPLIGPEICQLEFHLNPFYL